ncbi:MAG: Rap1a/Tai family immunity protein [Solidesulfovibrio sp. DCME]|uniref:Rap1a/Tai family immunity protein n=1 Tax=Solidesulfovibrio sp. DCME TaxID=3447380 RepID=UPI003D0FC20C
MKTIFTSLVVVALALSVSSFCFAQNGWPITGNDFLRYNKFAQGYYVMGICDVYSVIFQDEKNPFPVRVSYEQIREIVVNYLTKHPEDRHHFMPSIVLVAAKQAFKH